MLISLAITLHACGEDATLSEDAKGIMTVVRVVVRQSDGSWLPVPSAELEYQIFGVPSNVGNVPLLQQYRDISDESGLSAVLRDPAGKTDFDVHSLFVDATLPDGRTGFARARISPNFDFREWLGEIGDGVTDIDSLLDEVCETAVDFQNCASVMKAASLKMWGVGIELKVR